jgi:phospholipase C
LPYRLEATATVHPDVVALQLFNHGRKGAVFHLRSWSVDPSDMRAQMVTVDAGRHIRHPIDVPTGEYHVEVHGPNGFYRQFAGSGALGPEVTPLRPGSEDWHVVLTNTGPAVDLTVTSRHGSRRTQTVHLPHGARIAHQVADTQGWYDVSVTSSGDHLFARHLAGHREGDLPSISDPSLGR